MHHDVALAVGHERMHEGDVGHERREQSDLAEASVGPGERLVCFHRRSRNGTGHDGGQPARRGLESL